MSSPATVICLLAATLVALHEVDAQMIHLAAPQQTIGDSFHEHMGISWGLRGPGWSVNVPNGGTAWSQGSRRSMNMTSPSITTMDGRPGSFFSGTLRPFVTGLTPVVGGFVAPNEGLRQAAIQQQQATLNSIAQRRIKAQNSKAEMHWNRGQRAEQQGNLRMARANYRRALANAGEPLYSQIAQRMAQNGWSR